MRSRALSAGLSDSSFAAFGALSGTLLVASLLLALLAFVCRSATTSAAPDSQVRSLAVFILAAALFISKLDGSTKDAPSTLSFRASARTQTFAQAGLTATINLDDYKRAIGPSPFPTRAFMITTVAAQASGRTAHAVEQVRQNLNITDIQFVLGRNDLQDVDFGCETMSPTGCRMGLNIAMTKHYKAIAASNAPAIYLETDVLFHDDIATLLPLYWKQVPPDYEIVYLGSALSWLLVGGTSVPPSEPVRFGTAPYTMHCIALTAASAARFAALYTQLFRSRGWREEPGPTGLGISEVLTDLFMSSYSFRTSLDAQQWVSFESTLTLPAKFACILFRDEFKRTQQLEQERGCKCDNEYTLACRGYFPVLCVGLAFQNLHCNNMTRMHSWIAHYKADFLSSM